MRAASSVGEDRAARGPQSMKHASPRQARLIAPFAKLRTESGAAILATVLAHQKRHVAAWRSINDRLQLRQDRQGQLNLRLALLEREFAIANMLRPKVSNIACSLDRIEAKRKGQPSFGADRVRSLVLLNLGICPCSAVTTLPRRQLDILGRIGGAELFLHRELEEAPQCLEPVARGHRLLVVKFAFDELRGQEGNAFIAVLFSKAFQDRASGLLCPGRQLSERQASVVTDNASIQRAGLSTISADFPRESSQRLLIGRHEFGRAGDAGEGNLFEPPTPEIIIPLSLAYITMDVGESNARH